MSNNYNFDEVSNDGPTIIMGGHTYKLVYPTLEDVEKIQNMKTDDERAEAAYALIVKTDDSSPDFKDVIRKQSVKVLQAFTEMFKKEFGVEDE